MRYVFGLALLALMGCGADGDPLKPHGSVGVGIGSGGVSTNATLGASNDSFSVSVGF